MLWHTREYENILKMTIELNIDDEKHNQLKIETKLSKNDELFEISKELKNELNAAIVKTINNYFRERPIQ